MNLIKCPKCSNDFSLDSIMKKQAEELMANEIMKITTSIETEKNTLAMEKRAIQVEKNSIQEKINSQIEIEKIQLSKVLRKSIAEGYEGKVTLLEEQLKDNSERLKKAVAIELLLKTKQVEFEKRELELPLIINDAVIQKTRTLQIEIAKQTAEEYKKRDQEKDLQLSELRSQIVDWKHKAELGSQQLRGEVLEEELEMMLKGAFPSDIIEPVAKGVNGADIIHDVIGSTGKKYGRIIWESKRTKSFKNAWISKLKTDRDEARAEIAILVTDIMPEEHLKIHEIEGVWVIRPEVAIGVALILRNGLKDINKSLAISNSRSEKSEIIYNYLTSPTFKHRMEKIVESFTSMRDDLEKERRVTQRSWKHRENQLENIFQASLGMYSDIQLVLGSTSFNIPLLEYSNFEEAK